MKVKDFLKLYKTKYGRIQIINGKSFIIYAYPEFSKEIQKISGKYINELDVIGFDSTGSDCLNIYVSKSSVKKIGAEVKKQHLKYLDLQAKGKKSVNWFEWEIIARFFIR